MVTGRGAESIPRRLVWIALALAAVAIAAAVVVLVTPGSPGVAATMRAAGCTYRDVTPYPPKHDENYSSRFSDAQHSASLDDVPARLYDEEPVGMFGTPIAGLGNRIALTAWTAGPRWKGDPGLAYEHHFYGTGRIAICPRFDQKAFAAFRDAYRGRSPQGFPLAFDKPGCGPKTTCIPAKNVNG